MVKALMCMVFACLLLSGDAALRATGQDQPIYPGQPTQGKVWIQNRGGTEAVPVSIETIASDAPPLRVEVIGIPTVAIGGSSGQSGAIRQLWDYQVVTIPSGQDPAVLLNTAGSEGWEATGVTAAQGGTTVL